MVETLCFDICALIILLILIFGLEFRKRTTDQAGKRLMLLICVTIFALFFDITANFYDGSSGKIVINYICSGLYHILRNAAFCLYVSYIVAITGTWYATGNVIHKSLRFIPLILASIMVITTPVTKLIFYYGNDNIYTRGKFFSLIYIFSGIYALYALYFIGKNISFIGKKKALSLASCAFFSLFASIIQYFYPYLVVDILGFTLSLLYIVLYIDNPGDKIESVSLLMRYQAYVNDLRIACFARKPVDIIHINVSNNQVIEEMLSYSNYIEFIRSLSERLRECNGKGKDEGSLYYLKNGRFRVILEENNLDRSMEIANRICEAFNKEVNVNYMEFNVEACVSLTQCPRDFNILDELLTFGKVAAQYEKPGKVILTADVLLKESYGINSNVDKLIEKGILYNQFEVFYQPVYSVNTGRFSAAEALIRLRDGSNNIIEPDAFITAAEQNGSITELGKILLQDVCGFIASEDFEKTELEKISINLSVIQCLQKNLADQVIKLINDYNMPTDRIIFEITESLASDNQITFENNIKKLSETGINFALDKYGIGYSNITTLCSLPIMSIKLDRTFTNTGDNIRLKDILENSIEMVKGLNKTIVAGGIETEEMVDRFTEYGCEFLQGYYFAKPMPRAKLVEFYKERAKNSIG